MGLEHDRLTARLDSYLAVEQQTDRQILAQLSLMIFAEVSDSNLYELAKILPEDKVRDVVSYFDGAPIVSVPTKEEYKRCVTATVCYFLHHVKGKSWAEIKRTLSLPEDDVSFSTVALDRLLSNLDQKFKRRLEKLATRLTEEKLLEVLEEQTEHVSYRRVPTNGSTTKKTSKRKTTKRR